MRKIILHAFLLLCPILFQAQTKSEIKPKYSIGLNAILNYSDIYGKNQMAKDFGATLNYSAGISFEYKFNKNWSLLTNINYDRKFTEYDFEGNILQSSYKSELNLEYISVPILAKYFFPNTFIYATGGIYYSKLLQAKNYNDGVLNDIDFKDVFEKDDFGVVTGIGLQFYENEKETNAMNIELRNNFGLKDIGGYFTGIKTNSLYLMLNYTIEL